MWDFNDLIQISQNEVDLDAEPIPMIIDATNNSNAVVLCLPHTVRNISTKVMQSNSVMISSDKKYAVGGVRYEDI